MFGGKNPNHTFMHLSLLWRMRAGVCMTDSGASLLIRFILFGYLKQTIFFFLQWLIPHAERESKLGKRFWNQAMMLRDLCLISCYLIYECCFSSVYIGLIVNGLPYVFNTGKYVNNFVCFNAVISPMHLTC